LSSSTSLLGLTEPTGTEPFTRSVLNANSVLTDKAMVALMFFGAPFASGTISFGALTKAGGKPSSQSFTGPNGLVGTIAWSYTSNTNTTTVSITAPTAFTITGTFTKATGALAIAYS
jgi:hypothetical protein